MTKILCVVLAICCVFACMPTTAFAEGVEWVRVVDENVCLYATAESSKILFQLPVSFYLRVLSEEGSLFLVSVMENEANFPQITGYVWRSEVEICDAQPKTPYYPTERIVVDADSAQLKLTPTPSSDTIITITNSQKMSYYGMTESYGQTWYYVYFCGKFGYVLANCVTKPIIDMHPTPLVEEVVATPTPTPNTSSEKVNETESQPTKEQTAAGTTEIILIVFVALLALGICLALFLPGNLKKKDVFEDV